MACNQEDHKLKVVPPVNLVVMKFVVVRRGGHNSQPSVRPEICDVSAVGLS